MRRLAARLASGRTPWRQRLEALARDVDALLGRRPAGPFVRDLAAAPPGGARSPSPALVGTRWLTVREVVRETPDAVALSFEPPESPWTWIPGQFLTVHVPVDGERLRRAYSLSTVPGDPAGPAIAVKRVSGGKVSTFLVEQAHAGMRLEVRGPSGQFVLPPSSRPRSLLFVGGGSGITPLIALAEAALAAGDEVRLVYGNRSLADVIFRDRLAALAARFEGRFALRHVLESPPQGWQGGVGRLDARALERELAASAGADLVFSCGPAPMMEAVREAMPSLGIAPERLHEERFQSLGEHRAAALPTTPQALSLTRAGRRSEVLAQPGQTLLEAGLAAGVAMPFSCTMGGCGACRVKVRGPVVHDTPNGLSPEEAAGGYAFACIARPLGPCAIEVPS